jgi:hypothetical protein
MIELDNEEILPTTDDKLEATKEDTFILLPIIVEADNVDIPNVLITTVDAIAVVTLLLLVIMVDARIDDTTIELPKRVENVKVDTPTVFIVIVEANKVETRTVLVMILDATKEDVNEFVTTIVEADKVCAPIELVVNVEPRNEDTCNEMVVILDAVKDEPSIELMMIVDNTLPMIKDDMTHVDVVIVLEDKLDRILEILWMELTCIVDAVKDDTCRIEA